MSILVYDEYVNTLVGDFIKAGNIEKSVIVDAPEDIPEYKLKNKAVIRSEAETIEFYDADGKLFKTVSINKGGDGTDQEARNKADLAQQRADEAYQKADDADKLASKTHNIAVSAQSEAAINSTAIIALTATAATGATRLTAVSVESTRALERADEALAATADNAASLRTTDAALSEVSQMASRNEERSLNNREIIDAWDQEINDLWVLAENNEVFTESTNQSMAETKERQAALELQLDKVKEAQDEVIADQTKLQGDFEKLSKNTQIAIEDQWREINADRRTVEGNSAAIKVNKEALEQQAAIVEGNTTTANTNRQKIEEHAGLIETNRLQAETNKTDIAKIDEANIVRDEKIENAESNAAAAKGKADAVEIVANDTAALSKENQRLSQNNEKRLNQHQKDIKKLSTTITEANTVSDEALAKSKANTEAIEKEEARIDTLYNERVTREEFTELSDVVGDHATHIENLQREVSEIDISEILRDGSDISVSSITSDGSHFVDEIYLPSEPEEFTTKPEPVGGSYQFFVKNQSGSYSALLDFNKTRFNMYSKPIQNLASGGSSPNNAANISDVNRIVQESLNLEGTISHGDDAILNSLDMGHEGSNGQIVNLAKGTESDHAATVGQIEEATANVVKNGDSPNFNSVSTSTIKDPSGNLLLSSGNVVGLGLYNNYASFVNLDYVAVNTRSVNTRKDDDAINFKALKDYAVQQSDIDSAITNIFQSDVSLNNNALKNVSHIDGQSTRTLKLHQLNYLRSHDSSNNADSILFHDKAIDIRSDAIYLKTNDNVEKIVMGKTRTYIKGQPVEFQTEAFFDKPVTFNTDAAVSIKNALNMNGHSISNVRTANEDNKATNLGHIKQLISQATENGDSILSVDDIDWTPKAGKPRENTKAIITAMPNNSVLIGFHDKNTSYPETNIINKGGGDTLETQHMVFAIHKFTSSYATGIATASSGSSTVTRVLHNANNAWTAISTTSSFSLPEEEIAESPEGQIYFTQDQGVVASELNDNGETILVPIQGYNTPKVTQDLEDLKADNELGKSRTEYFKNENKITFEFNSPDQVPIVDCYVLETNKILTDSFIQVTDDSQHKYSGRYNTVGVVAISGGLWSTAYAFHNAYKHISNDYYVVFNMDILKWCIIEAANLHTEIGSVAVSVLTELGGRSSLPETVNGYVLDVNFENLSSLNFTQADKSVIKTDIENKTILIDFNQAVVSGYVVIK